MAFEHSFPIGVVTPQCGDGTFSSFLSKSRSAGRIGNRMQRCPRASVQSPSRYWALGGGRRYSSGSLTIAGSSCQRTRESVRPPEATTQAKRPLSLPEAVLICFPASNAASTQKVADLHKNPRIDRSDDVGLAEVGSRISF